MSSFFLLNANEGKKKVTFKLRNSQIYCTSYETFKLQSKTQYKIFADEKIIIIIKLVFHWNATLVEVGESLQEFAQQQQSQRTSCAS